MPPPLAPCRTEEAVSLHAVKPRVLGAHEDRLAQHALLALRGHARRIGIELVLERGDDGRDEFEEPRILHAGELGMTQRLGDPCESVDARGERGSLAPHPLIEDAGERPEFQR